MILKQKPHIFQFSKIRQVAVEIFKRTILFKSTRGFMLLFCGWNISPNKWSSISKSVVVRGRLLNQYCLKVWVVLTGTCLYVLYKNRSYRVLSEGLNFLIWQSSVVLCSSNQILVKGKSPKYSIAHFLITLLHSS